MVGIASLLIPILLSAVLVFVVSSVIHMTLTYHKNDFLKLPNEDGVMDALRSFNIPPGDYMVPHAGSAANMNKPEFQEKRNKGPVAVMTIIPAGPPAMGGQLAMWFLYAVLVSLFSAYVAGRALGPGADYMAVFRFISTVAFVGYALALMQNSIWYKRNWGMTLRTMFDGLIYGLLTAGVFGWLWP
jgi:hypothetical protein